MKIAEVYGTPLGNYGKVVSIHQSRNVYDVTSEIIENLDEYALKELLSGNSADIDDIINTVTSETYKALYDPNTVNFSETFDYLEKFTNSFENTLRRSVLNYFILTVLPKFELAPHLIEWGNLLQIHQYLCVIAARGHGKSYLFTYAYPLWKLYRYSDISMGKKSLEYSMSKEGMIITNEIGLATKFLSMIKTEIEDNSILREVLYPNTNIGWGGEEIHCKNGASLSVKSYGSRMRGHHPTFTVVDDFLDQNVLYSIEQKAKYNNTFHSVVMNMTVKNGQVAVVGTPFVSSDLYDDLKSKNEWSVFEYPALYPDGTILWESEHDFKSLMALKERIGSINFSREILVKPITEASSVFPYESIKMAYVGMDKYILVNNINSHPMRKTFSKVVVGMDFALSADVKADYAVFYVLGIDEADRKWLLHVFRGKGVPYDRQIAEAKRINRDFEPDVFVVETNGAQKIFADMMKEAGLPVLEHHTGVEKHSLNEGIPAMAVLFERGLIKLPRGDQHSRDMTDILASQLMSFTYDTEKGKLVFVLDHDDDSHSLWQACRGAKYEGTRFGFSFI